MDVMKSEYLIVMCLLSVVITMMIVALANLEWIVKLVFGGG